MGLFTTAITYVGRFIQFLTFSCLICIVPDNNNYDKEELEQMRQVVNNYNQQKADFLQLFSSFFSSEAGDVNRGVASLASCISILEQYLGTDILLDAGYEPEEAKKKR